MRVNLAFYLKKVQILTISTEVVTFFDVIYELASKLKGLKLSLESAN